MTVCLETTIQKWNINDGDDKPMVPEPAEGSLVRNIDTGARYIFHDGTWEEDRSIIYALQHL